MGYGTARARGVIQKRLDHMLLMTLYLVTITTDYRQTVSQGQTNSYRSP